jgi:hypothetical protein
MATREVLENEDLVRLIARNHHDDDDDVAPTLNGFVATRLRSRHVLRLVNRLFKSVSDRALHLLLLRFEKRMRRFARNAERVTSSPWADTKLQWESLVAMAGWPRLVFGLDLTHALVSERDLVLDQLAMCRWPTTSLELLDHMERKCVCCGTVCPHMAKSVDKWHSCTITYSACSSKCAVAPCVFGAWMLHPYKGCTKVFEFSDQRVRRPVRVLQGSFLAHTHPDHFFAVAFLYDLDDEKFRVQLQVHSVMTTEERRFVHFMRAARGEAWYESRLKRLFDLRPPELQDPYLQHCNRRHRPDKNFFIAQICMLEPRIVDAEDCSVQSIFGLSREKTLALIKRGACMLREERLLCGTLRV